MHLCSKRCKLLEPKGRLFGNAGAGGPIPPLDDQLSGEKNNNPHTPQQTSVRLLPDAPEA